MCLNARVMELSFKKYKIMTLNIIILSKILFLPNFQKGTWKFGLKDLGLSQVRIAKMNIFPLAVSVSDFQNMLEERKNEDVEYDGDNIYDEVGNSTTKASDGFG